MLKTVEIVSLSSGIIGEERLKSMGLQVKYSKNALKGIGYLDDHPEARAADLLEAYADKQVIQFG